MLRKTLLLLAALAATAVWGQAEELQRAMQRSMRGRSGSAVVLDVASGRVLAAVNLSGAARRVVRPGSTVKPFVLLALLSSGAVEPSASVACRRPLQIAGRKLDCGHPAIPTPLDAVNALAYSCNQYFTGMAARLRPPQMQQALLKAGFANAPGLTEREAAGSVELCQSGEQLQLQSIGVDHVTTTPLAMLNAYRQLALRRRAGDSDAALETVFRGLDAATEYGMARLAQPPGPVKVSGKTGTAKAQEGHWRHGWFAGFAPAEWPEIALVVFVERGTGPADAAPIAGRIFSAYFGRGEPGRQAGLPTNAGSFGSKR